MKERGILFSAPMMRANMAGIKTQTRRAVKPMAGEQSKWLTAEKIAQVPHGEMINGGWQMHHPRADTRYMGVDVAHDSPLGWIRSPYGAPGDRLWARENYWAVELEGHGIDNQFIVYDEEWTKGLPTPVAVRPMMERKRFGHHPCIHMPRWASRFTADITDLRAQRLKDISEEDALAEGVTFDGKRWNVENIVTTPISAVDAYRALWDWVNGRGSWDTNPWVWVISYKPVTP